MTSNQPYLLRAFYEWIVDNDLTPYIVVDATLQGVEVPQEFVKDGQIVLNVSPSACVNFTMDLDALSFQARFGGQPRQIYLPCYAVLAVYARENGAGTVFAVEEDMQLPETSGKDETDTLTAPSADVSDGDSENAPVPPKKGKPNLKVIK
ncbi:ClpXP protease specificity-enhancing factor [Alteromonas confluentis]|uniref:ClpXP protease specificity-enhancing factor n=2 Tax=Alteromonas confluentis TaxID=1656094 RepID=A0A1E7ZF87_9ALTE|nr:ClpXP protease specificity-enhancing factor [Alteromonas confluentis]OFC72167.1 ClpXP protease specificity-enhancing factor [Alteromonas confluentis]